MSVRFEIEQKDGCPQKSLIPQVGKFYYVVWPDRNKYTGIYECIATDENGWVYRQKGCHSMEYTEYTKALFGRHWEYKAYIISEYIPPARKWYKLWLGC